MKLSRFKWGFPLNRGGDKLVTTSGRLVPVDELSADRQTQLERHKKRLTSVDNPIVWGE